MKSTLIHCIALASILLFSLQTVGQQYPVQANLSISSPCPNKLSSLFPLSGSRLNLAILLTDVSQPELQARLIVKIEGAGLTIQSLPDFSMPVFTLQGGIPLALSHQLEPYFRVSSLTATGNGAMQFMQNGVLPEGFFTITVTVVEHRRNVPISNNAQTFAWVVVNDPPQLITPTNNQTVEPGGMQNVFISWAPRHVVTPMAGSQITYNLSLWEVPQGFDPQMVVNSLQPLETVNTFSTSVVWGPDKSALTPGKRYVVAVKAVDSSNEVIFKNNGQSIAHSFVYGQPCHAPINLEHSNVYIQTADVAWYPLGAAQNFRVEFKPSSEPDDAWRDIEVPEPNISLANLAPNTKYDYRVSAVCGSFVSNPTANRTFTTHAMQPLDNTCTPEVIVPQPDQSPLLSNLTPGLVFLAAGFMVETVTFKEIAPYTFDGTGIITLPLYKFALRANLKGVQINHSLHLVGGTVEAQYGDELTFLGEQGDEDQGPGSVDFSNPNDTIVLNSPIDSVYMNDDGTWTVVETDGDNTVITPGEGGTMVVDEDGNGVVIVGEEIYPVSDVFNDDPNGNGSGGGAGGGTGPNISPTSICNQRVNFAPGGSMHKYGFDTYKEALPSGTYSTIRVGEETLHLPWKSVATGGSDRLLVTPTADSTLTFSYQGGMPLTGSSTVDGYHVWSGSPPAGEDNLLALCSADSAGNASVAGGVRVKAYDLKRHKLAIVPVGSSQPSFTKAELQTALNSIYAQAVTEWEVTFEEPLDADGLTETPEVNETDYSNDMRAIWRAYVGQRTPVPGTTYLFIIQGFDDNPDMAGYMPLRSGYGFLTPTATTRDAAHELGHGVFNLRHTFSDNNVINLPQGSTKNLMDYSTGTELFKYQWDYIHNPEGGLFVFEDSEEGAFSLPCVGWFDDCKDVIEIIETFRNARVNGNKVKITGQEKAEERIFVANSVKFGDTDYKKIRLIYKPKPEDYSINTVIYEIYNQQFFIADGSVDWQRGFIYYNEGEELFKILVDDEVSKIEKLKEYLYGLDYDEILQIFANNTFLNAAQISDIREQIVLIKDEEQKKELYLELQEKVPYRSQRDNESPATDEDIANNSWMTTYNISTAGDIMCNLTSQAMCLEYLGVFPPCDGCSSSCDSYTQFEDYLECVRIDKGFDHRGVATTRKDLAELFDNVSYKFVNLETYDKTVIESKLKKNLEDGCSVLISAFGHIVRLQAITNDGLVVDDPYGKVVDFSQSGCSAKYKADGKDYRNGKDFTDTEGDNNVWKWTDLSTNNVKINYAEIYCSK